MRRFCLITLLLLSAGGCSSVGEHWRNRRGERTSLAAVGASEPSTAPRASESSAETGQTPAGPRHANVEHDEPTVLPASFAEDAVAPSVRTDSQATVDSQQLLPEVSLKVPNPADTGIASPLEAATVVPHGNPVQFGDVIGSVYRSYPLLQSALLSRNVALGQQVGASGAFDTKIKGASENGPLGFYESYRQSLGLVQPTFWGGEVFGGYRVGRGDFQPWYLERQTNEGGEFKAGVQVPLARNRTIDSRRAELWKAGLARQIAEPDIQAQLIGYVQEGSYAYWDWVAAGEKHGIAKRILAIAAGRTSRVEAQVKAGLVDPPELTDNLRLVYIRQAKVADTLRKLRQTSAKLSVYLRDENGHPIVATEEQLPGFPQPSPIHADQLEGDIEVALASRPELRMLDLLRRQVDIDYSEAVNQLQPEVSGVLWGSQDTGAPTSSKRDKSPFEGEASLFVDVPIQRRKARGKMTELQGKVAQISAKRRLTADKISVDVQMAQAALISAWDQVLLTKQGLSNAEDLAARERQNQEAGLSDMLKVALREQSTVEYADYYVDALRLYFESRADYRAAMAEDQIDR